MAFSVLAVGAQRRFIWRHLACMLVTSLMLSACNVPLREATRVARMDLERSPAAAQTAPANTQVRVQWAELVAAPALQTDRMLYRFAGAPGENEQRIGYFSEARWAAPIDRLVEQALRVRLSAWGVATLAPADDGSRTDRRTPWLRPVLERFEALYQGPNQGVALVVLSATLETPPGAIDTAARLVRWQCQAPLRTAGPAAAAQGLRLALDHVSQQLAAWIAASAAPIATVCHPIA